MRIFVTGASGFIGSAVVQELISAGHQVLGLARSDASAKALAAEGAEVHRGSLEDVESLRRGAEACDGIIHTAFIHDFSQYKASCEVDRGAIDALGSALAGSTRPLVVTSGTLIISPGSMATETTVVARTSEAAPRLASEEAADALVKRGINASVVRLSPSVHGDGDHGFVPALIDIARTKGVSAYVGDGNNRWPAVHRFDAARLFRLAVEKSTPGARYHGVGEEGIPVREIAAVIGKHLNVPVVSKSAQEAGDHFGWLSYFLSADCPASSKQTQQQLGWTPTHVGMLKDLDVGTYFK